MTELKTLKDMKGMTNSLIPIGDRDKWLNAQDLKQEAIKWVKDIRKRADIPENMLNRDRFMSV